MIAVLLFSAAFLIEPASPGAAAPAPATPVSPVNVTTHAKPKVAAVDPARVCRAEALLGSKITKKVCYSRGQMAERTFYDKQTLDLMQAHTPGPVSN